jgi:hypothetical protein
LKISSVVRVSAIDLNIFECEKLHRVFKAIEWNRPKKLNIMGGIISLNCRRRRNQLKQEKTYAAAPDRGENKKKKRDLSLF